MTSSTDEAGIRVSQVNRRQAIGSIAAGLTSSGAVWKAFPQAGVRVVHSPDDLALTYDYLIVGAGSAGCVLTHRLAQAGRTVLLIEAGGPATLPLPSSSHQTGLNCRAARPIGGM